VPSIVFRAGRAEHETLCFPRRRSQARRFGGFLALTSSKPYRARFLFCDSFLVCGRNSAKGRPFSSSGTRRLRCSMNIRKFFTSVDGDSFNDRRFGGVFFGKKTSVKPFFFRFLNERQRPRIARSSPFQPEFAENNFPSTSKFYFLRRREDTRAPSRDQKASSFLCPGVSEMIIFWFFDLRRFVTGIFIAARMRSLDLQRTCRKPTTEKEAVPLEMSTSTQTI